MRHKVPDRETTCFRSPFRHYGVSYVKSIKRFRKFLPLHLVIQPLLSRKPHDLFFPAVRYSSHAIPERLSCLSHLNSPISTPTRMTMNGADMMIATCLIGSNPAPDKMIAIGMIAKQYAEEDSQSHLRCSTLCNGFCQSQRCGVHGRCYESHDQKQNQEWQQRLLRLAGLSRCCR